MGTDVWTGTDTLFARPSFSSGAARILDLGGIFDSYKRSASEEDADIRALQGDWAAVGFDMKTAIEKETK